MLYSFPVAVEVVAPLDPLQIGETDIVPFLQVDFPNVIHDLLLVIRQLFIPLIEVRVDAGHVKQTNRFIGCQECIARY